MIEGILNLNVGDVLEFKKKHPCGGSCWKVLRPGVDYKLECTTCKRVVIIPRVDLRKKIKKININNNSKELGDN